MAILAAAAALGLFQLAQRNKITAHDLDRTVAEPPLTHPGRVAPAPAG